MEETTENSRQSKYRWIILSLLFAATTINYLDRGILGVLIQEIRKDYTITDIQYTYIQTAFRTMYALGFLIAGRFIDRVGTKLGYWLCIIFWSIVATLTGLSGSAVTLTFWRGAPRLTQSGNFPAAIKSVAEWFTIKQRAFATSLFNSGPSLSAVIGPPLFAAIALNLSWQWTFILIGSSGFILAGLWPFLYKQPKHLNPTNNNAHNDTGQSRTSWKQLLRHKATYGIMIGKFCTDPVWWFYMHWLPLYLYDNRGFDIKKVAFALPLTYGLAILLGNIAGWFPGYLIGRGWPVRRARKTVMLICALCLPISAMAVAAQNPWVAILLVSLACSAHNGWSANIFTLSSDYFPSRMVGSMTGLAGFAGGVGGMIFSGILPGFIIHYFGYVPIFMLMGVLHPLAFLALHLLLRDVKTVEVQ